MKGQIQIEYVIENGKMSIKCFCPLQDQAQKELSMRILLNAVGIVMDHNLTPLTIPSGTKITHIIKPGVIS